MASEYVLRRDQLIPKPIEQVFSFFSKAENLESITPPWLRFRIISIEPNPVRKGSLIRYRLRWRVVPVGWTTEISEWNPPHAFTDVQLAGPYRLWRHTHRFIAEGISTRMFDQVQYALPLGPLGEVAHRFVVKKDVEAIFDYRAKKITEMLSCNGCALASGTALSETALSARF